jgi:phosphoenolpyruvate carboxylase
MNRPISNQPEDGTYIEEVTAILRDLLRQVIKAREPAVLSVIDDPEGASGIPPHLIEHALQAIGIWLQLLNIAEENAAMRARRQIEKMGGPDEVIGSLSHAFGVVAASGVKPETVEVTLRSIDIQPTITAHPTEAKRVTVLEIHRRIYLKLYELESPRWTPREREHLLALLRNEIDLLWMTGEIRFEKPTVESEIAWGLHFFREALFDRTSTLCNLMEDGLRRHYPEVTSGVAPPLRFSSWIGGDRDGNPFVTTVTTRYALEESRKAAIARLDMRLAEAIQHLSMSSSEAKVPDDFVPKLDAQLWATGEAEAIRQRNPQEPFRLFFSALRSRLRGPKAFAHVGELINALRDAEQALAAMKASSVANLIVRPIRWEAEIFGFRTASLDIRQNTTVINRVLEEIWRKMHPSPGEEPPEQGTEAWSTWIADELRKPLGFIPMFLGLSDEANELLDLLHLIRSAINGPDPKSIGTFILSMTRSANDVLGLYLLAKYCGLFSDETASKVCRIAIVPLFETIEDLRAAPAIMEQLFASDVVRSSLHASGRRQEIMLGYSDSNKDGGFFCASFELFEAQRRLIRIGKEAGMNVSFFHGRGGSVSRGGAPTGRAIAAQPAGTINGHMRVTEQGEVVSSKFANRGTALNNLEVLTSSVLLHTLKSAEEPELRLNPAHQKAVEEIAKLSFKAYRKLAEDPALLGYFHASSPVEELALLKLGSRPARRFGAKGIGDLRAIPWVFAWSQNRHLLTGWYGLGYALDDFLAARGPEGLKLLRDMFAKSRGFRLAIDEVEKSLYLADMRVAERYAGLVPDRTDAERIFAMVAHEHRRTSTAVLELTSARQLCERFPGMLRRFERIRPIVDRANLWQVQLLRDTRDGKRDDSINMPLLMTMNCVAQGLGWTG